MKQSTYLVVITLLMISAAALSVVMIYPKSFSPLIAVSLFAGSVIRDKRYSLLIPVCAALLTAMVFQLSGKAQGFYGAAQAVDLAIYALIALISSRLIKRNTLNIIAFALIGCITFYLISNTSFFIFSNPLFHTYPQTFSGYLQNMVAALPFLRATLVPTGCYAAVFFGVYAVSEKVLLQRQIA